jgi:FtsZ-interacting cell division protein YlmF
VAVTDKIRSVVDFLVRGFDPREAEFEDIAEDMQGDYETVDNLAVDPGYSYSYHAQPEIEKSNQMKVVSHPNFKGYEVKVMEPRSFDDAAAIVQNLKERKTVVLNLHLLNKEQSQRTIDFVCGAAHALNGNPQKVGDLVFIFTPSNVTLSIDTDNGANKFDDTLWRSSLQ